MSVRQRWTKILNDFMANFHGIQAHDCNKFICFVFFFSFALSFSSFVCVNLTISKCSRSITTTRRFDYYIHLWTHCIQIAIWMRMWRETMMLHLVGCCTVAAAAVAVNCIFDHNLFICYFHYWHHYRVIVVVIDTIANWMCTMIPAGGVIRNSVCWFLLAAVEM